MASPAPAILALEPDSTWAVIVVVSAIALPLVLLLRKIIHRPGGRASAYLLGLPLVVPLVAALLYGHPVVPEVTLLRPAATALGGSGRDLGQLLLVRGPRAGVLIPYAPAESTGPWLLLVGIALSSAMVLRRLLGAVALHRMIRRSRPLDKRERAAIGELVEHLAVTAGLPRTPEVLVLPGSFHGALAAGSDPGRVLISADVMEALDSVELEAVLAHEIAHLAAGDSRLLAAAGLLRDLVAWNPLAHVAFRCLKLDREIEADRAAAGLTGKPLAVASSLVKMCELLAARRPAPSAGVGFWSARDRLRRRVASLLALADGQAAVARSSGLPFVAAGCLAAVIALQMGGSITQGGGGALAVVWGATGTPETRIWTPEIDPWRIKRETRDARTRAANRSRLALDQPLPPQSLAALRAAPAVQEEDLDSWMLALSRAVNSSSAPFDLTRRAGWRVQPLFADSSIGSFGVYSVKPFRLDPRLLGP